MSSLAHAEIIDFDSPQLDPYRNLKQTNLTRWSGRFIAEGLRVVRRLLESSYDVESLLMSVESTDLIPADLRPDVPRLVVTQALAEQLVGFHFHAGVLACGRRKPSPHVTDLAAVTSGEDSLIVVCPRTTDPDNLGGLIRLSAAFGASGLILGPGCADPFSRRTLRVSMGTALFLPILEPPNLADVLTSLRSEHAYTQIATVLDPQAISLAKFAPPRRIALLLGNEADGLDEDLIGSSDVRLTIPMSGEIDSLNVTVSAGIFLHALRRSGSKRSA